jgi:hypothetical protein
VAVATSTVLSVHLGFVNQPATVLAVQGNLAHGTDPVSNAGLNPFGDTKALRRFVKKAYPLTVTWLTAPGGSIVQTFARSPQLVNDLAEAIGLLPFVLIKELEQLKPRR